MTLQNAKQLAKKLQIIIIDCVTAITYTKTLERLQP